ncbi:MAG TPA: hypothetical protein VJS14_13200, partial [Enterobacteriaceae bacterium]|nr:hypothetical protein [Enterobacteriaceae bacterium]
AVFDHLRIVCRRFKKATQTVRSYHHIHKAKRLAHITYDSAINMAQIGKGIQCYSKNLSILSVNTARSEHFIISISGNKVTLDEVPDYGATISDTKMLYQDAATGKILSLDIASVSNKVVTLSDAPPAELIAGKAAVVITTVSLANQ